MNPILEIQQLTHTYSAGTPFQRTAVEGVDLSVMPGECVGIIGHTGSGKSTLIQHFNGLLKPTSGHVLVDGQDIWAKGSDIRAVRFRVGLVFQYPEYQLFEETVAQDIAFGPKNMGLSAQEVARRVGDAAAVVGLDESLLSQSPFALSGGQKRRAAIAGVMAMEPDVLVLDEPSAGLDPRGRQEMMAMLRRYRQQRGATVILVSHSMEEIAANVDRVIVMNQSKVFMDGAPREVFSRVAELEAVGLDVPQSARIAALLRDRGLAVGEDVYTVDALARRLLALKGGDGVC